MKRGNDGGDREFPGITDNPFAMDMICLAMCFPEIVGIFVRLLTPVHECKVIEFKQREGKE